MGGKIDVLINVLDQAGQATRKLEQVKYSVKLSKGILGQVARGKTSEEVYQNLEKLFQPLGVDLSSVKQNVVDQSNASGVQTQYAGGMQVGYEEAYNQLNSLLSNKINGVEQNSKFISDLCNFINIHSSKNDPSIQTIQVDETGKFVILNYNQLYKEIKRRNIEIEVALTDSFNKERNISLPIITFYDQSQGNNQKGKLVEIRFRFRGNYANHAVIPGKLLKDLATYKRFKP
jgi:hypothetical protein